MSIRETQESEIYRECIRPPPNRTVQQTTAALGGANFPPSGSPSPATLPCCPAPGCGGGSGGYRGHSGQRHGAHANHLRPRRKANGAHHPAHQEAGLDPKRPDGLLCARLEAPPPPSVMVPSGGKSFGKSLRERVNAASASQGKGSRNGNEGYWSENSRSKLASLTVVSCSSASSVDGESPTSSGRASPAKPADAHT